MPDSIAVLADLLEDRYDIAATAKYLLQKKFRCVALQFPDSLLHDSPAVVTALQDSYRQQSTSLLPVESRHPDHEDAAPDRGSNGIDGNSQSIDTDGSPLDMTLQLYVTADTSFGSCCVDEVAAAHVAAECVVHYGPACLSKCATLPVRFVLGRFPLDAKDCAQQVSSYAASATCPLLVVYDLQYAHAIPSVQEAIAELRLPTEHHLLFTSVAPLETHAGSSLEQGEEGCGNGQAFVMGGLVWEVGAGRKMEEYSIMWIGQETAALTQFVLTFNTCKCSRYDPQERVMHSDVGQQSAVLRRRYYLVEKAKDANMVGIVVATLAVAGYLEVIQLLRALIKRSGKRSYTFVVGKVNPAKLANFPECDVFVLLACPHSLLLECRDYLAPIITPYEAQLAFQKGKGWSGAYRLDFGDLASGEGVDGDEYGLEDGEEEPRFSMISGQYVGSNTEDDSGEGRMVVKGGSHLQIQKAGPTTVSAVGGSKYRMPEAKSAADYFVTKRMYKGLEVPPHFSELEDREDRQEEASVHAAVEGRRGRAASYVEEGSHQC